MASDGRLHSRVVAILKLTLPLAAVLLLASLFLTSGDDALEGELVFSASDVPNVGADLQITRPTFSGMTRDDDRFVFSAETVVPDAVPPKRASVTALTGRVEFTDGRAIDLKADLAELDVDAREIALRGAVNITTSDGYLVTTDALDVDLGTGGMKTVAPVVTQGPLGEITADRLAIAPDETGQRMILFDDRVRLVYRPLAGSE